MKLTTAPLNKTFYKKFDPLFDPFFFEGDILHPKLTSSSEFFKEILSNMEKYSPSKSVKHYDDRIEIDLLIPNVCKEEVSVELYKNELTISYKHDESKNVGRKKFAPKDFSETFFIDGEKYDLDKISTIFEKGVLSIYVHAIEKVEPKFEKKSIKIS